MALETRLSLSTMNDVNTGAGTDPWSDETWGKTTALGGSAASSASFDASPMQGDAVFPFPADPTADLASQLDGTSQSSATDFLFEESHHFRSNGKPSKVGSSSEFLHTVDGSSPTNAKGSASVRVAIHEQVSALYDGVTDEPVCHVEGSLYVQPSQDLEAIPFLLVIRDLENHVGSWKDWPSTCQNVTDQVSRKGLHRTDRLVRVTTKTERTNSTSQSYLPQDNLIAQYVCTDRVRPVPLLIKSRVVSNNRYCRVGFKVRANPSNTLPLTRVVLMLAIPPHIEGRTAKMSRKGGVWDELKRTISWVVPKLEPGHALEIQAQFEGPGTDGTQENSNTTPRFPILARGDYAESYSGLDVRKSDVRDGVSHPVHSLKINRSGRVLHRKV